MHCSDSSGEPGGYGHACGCPTAFEIGARLTAIKLTINNPHANGIRRCHALDTLNNIATPYPSTKGVIRWPRTQVFRPG